MEYILALKLIKYTGLVLFSCSLGIVVVHSSTMISRWKAVNWGMGTGFFLLWVGGYGMLKALGYTVKSPWVMYGQFFSIACVYFASLQIGEKKDTICSIFSILSLFFALVGMILKDLAANVLHLAALSMLLAFLSTLLKKRSSTKVKKINDLNLNWFRLIAWLEGLSLLTLLFLYMPLKYWASISLDNNQGWFGWIHGVLQIMFILSLVTLHSTSRVSIRELLSGLLASIFPFGTMIYERRLMHRG